MRLGAIDVGTNTVRLIVAEGAETLERSQLITRLGRGVDATDALETESIARTRDAVEAFVLRARELGAQRIRVAGTSALRNATNAGEFAAAVKEATGLALEVLDGDAEGRHAYAGATSWLEGGPYLVCDIGGGSTELITETGQVSVDVGSVRLRERYLAADPPARGELEGARQAAEDAIARAVADLAPEGSERLVGVAGTITTLAALELGLRDYDDARVHGSTMSAQAVGDWSRRLNAMSADGIRALGPVESGRADVLGAGVLILDVVMGSLRAPEVIVSVRDILDGLVLDLAQRLA